MPVPLRFVLVFIISYFTISFCFEQVFVFGNHSAGKAQRSLSSEGMFGGYDFEEDPGEPTSRDVGKFLSKAELLEWHSSMKKELPQVFPADDKLFGDDGGQHPFDTKLMTWFDDDPDKPMRVEVKGSRWMIEYGDKTPVYVIVFKGQSELSQIPLTSAHEEGGWKVGWDLEPPKK